MMRNTRLARALATLCLIALPLTAQARPVAYILQTAASSVAFETDFGRERITGTFPLARADLTLDFENVANCTIDVTLDVTHAKASFPFAAQALRGPTVLDAGAHPEMHFVSTRIKAHGDGADVSGNITIRGVTRPVTLRAVIYQQKGSAAGDRSHLSVRLTGRVRRSEFGATGWADLVGDEVRIRIDARIAARG
jgi:polyisoprenoid-binding protein YceI